MFKVLLQYLLLLDFSWSTLRSIVDYFGRFFSSCCHGVFIGNLPGSPGLFPKKRHGLARPDSHEFCWSYGFFKPPGNFSPAKMSFPMSNVVRLNFIDRWWCCWMVESLLRIHTSLLWIPTWMSLHTQWCLPMWHGASKHREGQVRRVVGPGMWEFVGSTSHLQSPCTLHKVSVDFVTLFVG